MQRGRKSAASLDIAPFIPPAPKRTSVQPPPTLSEAAKRVFEQLASSVDREHFITSDIPLLAQYAEAVILAENSAAELQTSPSQQALVTWEKIVAASSQGKGPRRATAGSMGRPLRNGAR